MLKCDYEVLRNGDKIEDVVWKVWKRYWRWISVVVCNRFFVCMVNELEVIDGIKVFGIIKGIFIIKCIIWNVMISYLDFKCEIYNGLYVLKYYVKIKFVGECKFDFSCFWGFLG